MSSNIVTEQELMTQWGIGQRCKLIEYLNSRHIPYDVTPKGKVWTVQEALRSTEIWRERQKRQGHAWYAIAPAAKIAEPAPALISLDFSIVTHLL